MAPVLALQTPAVHRAVRRLATFEKLRSGLERLDHKLRSVSSRGTKPITPTHRRDVKRIARILERLLRLEDGLEIDIGDLLLELHEHEAWNQLGFSGIESYAETRLGVAGSTARRRVALARSLRPLPLVRQAYEAGIIGFVAAEWIARALRADRANAETQRQLIAHARAVTVKRLGQEERRREGERLLARIAIASAGMPVPAKRGAPHVAPAATKPYLPNGQTDSAILSDRETAKRSPLAPTAAARAPRPRRAFDSLPMDDAAWHASLRRVPGETRSKVFDLGYGLLDRLVRGGPLTHVTLTLRLRAPEAVDLLGCIEAARRGLGRLAASSTAPAEDTQLAPSARMARDFHDHGLRIPAWVGLLALLEEWVWVHDDPRSMPLRPERHILERDGYRCMAPGCMSRRRLHVHHLRYRSHAGSDDDWNLLVLCSYHHLQGEHGGLARIRGRAPLDVTWRLGCSDFAVHYRNERRIDIESAA